MIRAKKITYLEMPAIAIYFQNMTQHINYVRLEGQVLEQRNRNESLQSFTSTISHEFRTPLGTALMFLEQLLTSFNLSSGVITMLTLIINQLNLLLCLVNDVLDMKLIEQGKFDPKLEKFSPKSVLDFIVSMFEPQSNMLNTVVSVLPTNSTFMKPLFERKI